MPIHVPKPKSFTPCPKGQFAAVCVDVVDLGELDTGFVDERTGKPKFAHKVDIVWQVDATMENGKRYIVNERYSLTFADYPKMSNLRLLLDAWNVHPDDLLDDAGEWDIEGIIGLHGDLDSPCRSRSHQLKYSFEIVRHSRKIMVRANYATPIDRQLG